MSVLDLDPDRLLPGLLPGAFRGVPFFVPDIRHEAGRRVIRTLFPGLDDAAVEDLGVHRGVIWVTGLILGEDYVLQAEALRIACETAGPGVLLHPWLGERLVVVAEPAEIGFSTRELRAARFRAGFFPAPTPGFNLVSTLAALLGAIEGVLAPARAVVQVVAGAAMLPTALWASACGMAQTVGLTIDRAAAASRGADALQGARRPQQAALAAAAGAPDTSGASALGAAVVDLPAPIATLALAAQTPAIGPAQPAAQPAGAFAPRDGADLLLSLSAATGALDAIAAPERAVQLAASAAIVAQAARAAADIPYESRQEAMAWRARLMAALDALDAAAGALAADYPDAIARLLAALAALRSSIAADINEAIGRLPTVIVATPPALVSAWLIAQHYAGDDPAAVVSMLDDIVTRNRLRHPGVVAGPVEVLA